jgi:hypothetical protein
LAMWRLPVAEPLPAWAHNLRPSACGLLSLLCTLAFDHGGKADHGGDGSHQTRRS